MFYHDIKSSVTEKKIHGKVSKLFSSFHFFQKQINFLTALNFTHCQVIFARHSLHLGLPLDTFVSPVAWQTLQMVRVRWSLSCVDRMRCTARAPPIPVSSGQSHQRAWVRIPRNWPRTAIGFKKLERLEPGKHIFFVIKRSGLDRQR